MPKLSLAESIEASKHCCSGCPFNDGWTEEATNLQNLGCLPTAFEMLERHEHGEVISCHCNNKIPCRGIAAIRDVSSDKIIPYSVWHKGE